MPTGGVPLTTHGVPPAEPIGSEYGALRGVSESEAGSSPALPATCPACHGEGAWLVEDFHGAKLAACRRCGGRGVIAQEAMS